MTPSETYQQWLKDTAHRLSTGHPIPSTAAEARSRAAEIRRKIAEAEGSWPRDKAPLDPQVRGTLQRDGYRVEHLIFQTRAGCYATSSVYVPTSSPGPFPAVLCVHGHWRGARRDPVVQSRCIGLAKLGFVALTLDAWGAGERGSQIGSNEYHGGLLGSSLWPVGTPLHAMQLYDNVRALDYLQSRPDVIPGKIGCTGASGGGNQTTYISAFDERIQCAVPVCSVGTFESYLTTASCVDEVLLGGLTIAEEGDLLGMVAPRWLMIVTATRDAYHFGPGPSGEAFKRAQGWFRAQGVEGQARHSLFESGHDYNQAMREAMYGWMTRSLKGQGDGSPIPEPALTPEDPEAIRCFVPPHRSAKVVTTAQWVHQRARSLVASVPAVNSEADWRDVRAAKAEKLHSLLGKPGVAGPEPAIAERAREVVLSQTAGLMAGEKGVHVPFTLTQTAPHAIAPSLMLLLHPRGRSAALTSPLARELQGKGLATAAIDLRGCGDLVVPKQGDVNGIPDHNLVEWSFWIGRPLLGQWVQDVLRFTKVATELGWDPRRIVLVGWREGGLAALLASAVARKGGAPAFRGVAAFEAPSSYVSETAPHGQRMVSFLPSLLEVGDVPHLAALSAPQYVLLGNPIRLDGMAATQSELDLGSAWARNVFEVQGRGSRFSARAGLGDAEAAARIRGWLV
jgi:dienelactone hydrolase